MVSLLVSADFNIATLTDCTQKVPLFDLESSERYSASFSCYTHSRIWVPTRKTI